MMISGATVTEYALPLGLWSCCEDRTPSAGLDCAVLAVGCGGRLNAGWDT
jgi:hypothetical protein